MIWHPHEGNSCVKNDANKNSNRHGTEKGCNGSALLKAVEAPNRKQPGKQREISYLPLVMLQVFDRNL